MTSHPDARFPVRRHSIPRHRFTLDQRHTTSGDERNQDHRTYWRAVEDRCLSACSGFWSARGQQ